jgi:hypothetical protein
MGPGVRRDDVERAGPSWFETRGFATLLTMRVYDPAANNDLILRNPPQAGVSKDGPRIALPFTLRVNPPARSFRG